MKQFLYSLLIISLCTSCQNNSNQHQKKSTTTNINDSKNFIKRFKPFIQGVWVKKDYIDDLLKTRSPYLSFKKLGGICSILIRLPATETDSVFAGISLNNHEGSNFVFYNKSGNNSKSLKTNIKDYMVPGNYYELGYDISKADTNLVIYHYNKNNQFIDSIVYNKVLNTLVDDNMGSEVDYITNKLLISGNYTMVDSLGNHRDISFTNDGNILGWTGLKTYCVNTDFEAGPANNIDQLIFDLYTKHQTDYAFKIKMDTLDIYTSSANADSTESLIGQLRYQLIRKK